MDRDEFRKEIIGLVTDQELGKTGRLSAEQMQEHDDKVYAHIRSQFTVSEDKPSEKARSLGEMVEDFVFGGYTTIAATVVALVAVGGFSLYVASKNTASLLPGLPDTLVNAEFDEYVELPIVSKGISRRPLTERRNAFLVGMAKAGIELGSNETDKRIANYLMVYTGQSLEDELAWFEGRLDYYSDDPNLSRWVVHGFATELLSIAAQGSSDKRNMAAVRDALELYKTETSGAIRENDRLPRLFIDSHNELLLLDIDGASESATVGKIVKLARVLKVGIE